MNEEERLAHCRDIAERMYLAGMGDCYDALERLTRIELQNTIAITWCQQVDPVCGVRIRPLRRLARRQHRKRMKRR